MLFENSVVTTSSTRAQIRDFYRKDEGEVLEYISPIADVGSAARSRAWERARELVIYIRAQQTGKGGVDALLNEFALSTEEGVVLMCLAEALLRVPDSLTIDRLIRDKLSTGDWSSHLGNSDSLFVNASAWGLLLTGKVVTYNDEHTRKQLGLLKKTMGRLGEPVIRSSVRYAMKIMGTQFVLGTNIQSAAERARPAEAEGYTYSYDMLGEGARTMADADRYFDSYVSAIDVIGKVAAGRGPYNSPGISIKLSAIHPRYEFSHRERVMSELLPRLKQLALTARQHDIGFTVDAEEADRLEISLDIIEALFSDPDLAGWEGFGIAVQAYQRRGIVVIEWLRELTQRVGRKMMVRLTKGAYWDTEIKLAQVEGFGDFPVFTQKDATDVCYQACAKKLLQYRDTIYPQFATHNAYTVATILEMDSDRSGYEFQRLHGMGDALYDQVLNRDKVPVRIYAPVGEHADLLAYLVRRLLENGSNSSFVNNIVDESIPVEALLDDPLERVINRDNDSNPFIPLPANLYGTERHNAAGTDLTDPELLAPMRDAMNTWLVTLPLDYSGHGEALAIVNPADNSELIGTVSLTDAAGMETALDNTGRAFDDWSRRSTDDRAELLCKLSDALERNRDELIALCAKEAGKTIPDGVAEVREAVDFCRYYAARAMKEDFAARGQQARGVVLCISPWNFPLAIFLGQISAALAAGNTVIAKPAEQTSLMAIRTIELMKDCRFPAGVVELVIARGPEVGEILVPDERVKAVMFTGSTETGSWISRRLSQRPDAPIPLIAETGGQNCMLVDSTSLPEQVVDDVIHSGFQSAGQRCSALRVLFLQDEIADKTIEMICGAMAELTIGDPSLLSTDIGPVIDSKARQGLCEHASYLSEVGRKLYTCNAPDGDDNTFFAPALYEISNLSLLPREIFGPIVHVIRYRASELDGVLQQINDTGYGLTFGLHSRIEQLAVEVTHKIKAGNIYINRNMIGAIVGVQPFGGRGLSGTGPKAGGPEYLTRLVTTGEEAENATQQKPLPGSDTAPRPEQAQSSVGEKPWASLDLNTRISTLRQYIARHAKNTGGENNTALEQTLAAAREQLNYAADILAEPRLLPGPTGESNKLYLEPRGGLVIVLDDALHNGEYLMAILSALVAGNTVCAITDNKLLAFWQDIASAMESTGLPDGAFSILPLGSWQPTLLNKTTRGVMVHASSVYLHSVAQCIAAREGPIIPLISSVSPQSLLRQTMLEKTVSIDTTAAGGNASLMTMAS